jgi:hypothetical protein
MITTNKGKKQKIVIIVSSPYLISNHHTLTFCLLPTISFEQQHGTNRRLNKNVSILLLSAMANFSLILGYCKLESQH